MRKAARLVYFIYAVLMFVIGLLIIIPFVIFSIFLKQPISGNVTITLCRMWSDYWLFFIGIRSKTIAVSPIDPNRHFVFVANHSSYLDIPLIFQPIRKNPVRILGKAEMAKIPIFGIVYRLATVAVDRSSRANRSKSIVVLKKMLDKNISILIFPEGTFNETDEPLKSFYDGAFRIAIETNTPIKPIVFLDSGDRMHHSSPLNLNPGISRTVILPEVSVEGLTGDDIPMLKQQVFDMMSQAFVAYRNKPASVITN